MSNASHSFTLTMFIQHSYENPTGSSETEDSQTLRDKANDVKDQIPSWPAILNWNCIPGGIQTIFSAFSSVKLPLQEPAR